MDSRRSSRFRVVAALLTAAVLAGSLPAGAGEAPHFAARTGLVVATAAAQSWAVDARLIYVENDADVDSTGTSERWGYLFFSKSLDRARAYSVRNGRIVTAENLEMKFEAPPLTDAWLDSGQALAAAEKEAGLEFRAKQGGELSTMLLVRGVFQDGDPDLTTWAVVYRTASGPSLFVVVDAASGRVRRTWRG
jgi:hypothetical protein